VANSVRHGAARCSGRTHGIRAARARQGRRARPSDEAT
jgi:hypothetical protein